MKANDFGVDAAMDELLFTVRSDFVHRLIRPPAGETHGYVFFNNYQRLHTMKRHEKVSLKGLCADGTISFPETTIEDGEEISTRAEIKTISKNTEKAVYEIHVTYAPSIRNGKELLSDKDAVSLRKAGRDALLWLRYAGERMALYLNGEKINDHFYTGQDVPVSLGYFHFPEVLRLEVEPLEKDAPFYLEKHPDYVNRVACELISARVEDV